MSLYDINKLLLYISYFFFCTKQEEIELPEIAQQHHSGDTRDSCVTAV